MGTGSLHVRVECNSECSDEQAPGRFFLGKRAVDVIEVIDRWFGQDHGYFKVRGSDRGIYILRHDMPRDLWEMTLYDCGTRAETRLSST